MLCVNYQNGSTIEEKNQNWKKPIILWHITEMVEMKNALADALNFASVALYNLSIWYDYQLQMMDGKKQAKTPLAYQSFAHHINHLCLAFLNRLVQTAGLDGDVDKDTRGFTS